MGAHFGPWDNLRDFQERIFGGRSSEKPGSNRHWWGIQESEWFKKSGYNASMFQGFYIDNIKIAFGKYRIPPNELKDMLPQQLLMLNVADAAFNDAGYKKEEGLETGVFIGLGLDLCTTNFHFRWSLYNQANEFNTKRDSKLSQDEFDDLVKKMRDAAGPPLTADRTMGALGGIVASRIAREFSVGGPSHTLSSEESSGIHAFEVAVHALQKEEINQALVGAVDLAGDVRSVINTHIDRPYSSRSHVQPFDESADGAIPGEGAAALVLKRLDDAERDGNRIYAIVNGIGGATGGNFDTLVPDEKAYQTAMERAYDNSEIDPYSIQLLETHGSAYPPEDIMEANALKTFFNNSEKSFSCFLGSVKSDIGHTGAAAGLASLIKVCLCLYQEILPPLRNLDTIRPELEKAGFVCPKSSQFWLRNKADGPRRAGISCFSMDGNCTHIVMQSYESSNKAEFNYERLQPLGVRSEAIFAIEGNSISELENGLTQLRNSIENNENRHIEYWARKWWNKNPNNPDKQLGLSFLARDSAELLSLITKASDNIQYDNWNSDCDDRIFFNPKPIGKDGQLAFVFPGFGNHFPGMGRELSVGWPEIFYQQDQQNKYLHDQFMPDYFWYKKNGCDVFKNHKAMISGQVFLGTAVSDLIRHFGVNADAMIGYSLGESAGLVALGAWIDRDEMIRRMNASSIFANELVGECRSARKSWNIPEGQEVSWTIGVLDCSASKIEKIIKNKSRVYLLIINTPEECVIGGDNDEIEALVKKLGCRFLPIYGAPTVHCEVAKVIEKEYREFHSLKTAKPKHTKFYSMAWKRNYPISSTKVSDSMQAQAFRTVDFPALISNAYEDGVRLFLEIGPGVSCTRMISSILQGKPHMARAVCYHGQDSVVAILRLLAHLIAERAYVDLKNLYGVKSSVMLLLEKNDDGKADVITVPTDSGSFKTQVLPLSFKKHFGIEVKVDVTEKQLQLPSSMPGVTISFEPIINHIIEAEEAKTSAHQNYLTFADNISKTISQNLTYQMQIIETLKSKGDFHRLPQGIVESLMDGVGNIAVIKDQMTKGDIVSDYSGIKPVPDNKHEPALNREMCMEFAIGSIGKVLGPEFSKIDSHPTRVRLPDEPLMLVDRIMEIHGEPRSMTSGRVITEHDVLAGAWYLDNERIPTCIAVEAGQADLFLSGYLGIDFETEGNAVYRLLDAEVTFHNSLPTPGTIIHYDIQIDHFFRQGDTYLFRFNFESNVNGKPLLTMENGCAGFFTQAELDAGQGIVRTEFQKKFVKGIRPNDWVELVSMENESYNDTQISALRNGDFTACFGFQFNNIILNDPLTLPDGKMKLVDRVLSLEPKGGRFGLGIIRAEADIHPDDWFLTCHFVDDKVMPGTLMYECCLHTLRIYLMRMGWVAEKEDAVCEPVPGVKGRLKCRGQVLETTQKVLYEIEIRELGYRPEPYAIVNALMYADGKAIVEITDMSVRLTGLTRRKIENLWQTKEIEDSTEQTAKKAIFDNDSILAFAIGKPSEAFGEPYKIFDHERIIARLPGPPYKFLDRITEINAEPWKMVAGGDIVAEYDISPDEWYFAAHRHGMPFSVLLEIALQPCGWLAAYVGSALTSDVDLAFRNLGGDAIQYVPVKEHTGTLFIAVKITSVSTSGGMVIQHYDFDVSNAAEKVYKGKTYFGFFTKASLADQVGIVGAKLYKPDDSEVARGRSFPYPSEHPYPVGMMRMIDHISLFVPDGGPEGKGFIRGIKKVDPDEWFFKAHFYQDPVCPGSLGLESFLQLLQVLAVERWGKSSTLTLETIAINERHEWIYRGQIIPTDSEVIVEAVVTNVNDDEHLLHADGFLIIDGRIIYQLKKFSIRALG